LTEIAVFIPAKKANRCVVIKMPLNQRTSVRLIRCIFLNALLFTFYGFPTLSAIYNQAVYTSLFIF